jgi:asparagine synthetase B (glutamine-hydrolysing)
VGSQYRIGPEQLVATTVSGGLDSSSIHAVVSRIHDRRGLDRMVAAKPTAFVGLVEGEIEEERAARRLVEHSGSEGVFTRLDEGEALDRIPDVVYDTEEISHLSLGGWANFRRMRQKGFRVSLDGHGADELTGGYREFILPAILDQVDRIRNVVSAARGMTRVTLPSQIDDLLGSLPSPWERLPLEKLYPGHRGGPALTRLAPSRPDRAQHDCRLSSATAEHSGSSTPARSRRAPAPTLLGAGS